ncbi:MAG TPA: alanine--tRNA ligase-related protein, partial [Candidatus Saccharimonadales bacterium]|nr:alanine--tRNA ligase-related protein [Candidatus Saccharimonadales bacterium]
MTASDIIKKYITFFEQNGHTRIENAPLIPQNDPTTLFTSSGMQPLVPYLLGETHPHGKRLVNVQNSFRAQDIEEIGDNRHTTFFRMLGNWSLGDYFKKEQIPWFFEFLTDSNNGLGLDPKNLYVTVFEGNKDVPKDDESIALWKEVFANKGIDAKIGERIFTYGVEKNWWSRSGIPDKMPVGEPGGPDSEVFYDFGKDLKIHEKSKFKNEKCHVNCDCGRFMEIGNSVFMQYQKQKDGSFKELPQRNVDFGGGLERLLAAVENQQDVFQTSLLKPIIRSIEAATKKDYASHQEIMRIIADHFIAASFITNARIVPSNKEQGYILRRLIRRGLDNLHLLSSSNNASISSILEGILEEYSKTDPGLDYEFIKNTILEETAKYEKTKTEAKRFIEKNYPTTPSGQVKMGDELMGVKE